MKQKWRPTNKLLEASKVKTAANSVLEVGIPANKKLRQSRVEVSCTIGKRRDTKEQAYCRKKKEELGGNAEKEIQTPKSVIDGHLKVVRHQTGVIV